MAGKRKQRSRTKWMLRFGAVGTGLIVALLLVSSCVGTPAYFSEKYSPIGHAPKPVRTGAAMKPVRQTEGHTCGFCALSAVYVAYGLDPEAMRLRFRLGTDKPVTWLDKSTIGTLPQDIDRVLDQDGFDAEHVDTSSPKDRTAIREHLSGGNVALALVRVNELHWLILSGIDGEDVVICDSLRDKTYKQPLGKYLDDRVLRLVLIKPKS